MQGQADEARREKRKGQGHAVEEERQNDIVAVFFQVRRQQLLNRRYLIITDPTAASVSSEA